MPSLPALTASTCTYASTWHWLTPGLLGQPLSQALSMRHMHTTANLRASWAELGPGEGSVGFRQGHPFTGRAVAGLEKMHEARSPQSLVPLEVSRVLQKVRSGS